MSEHNPIDALFRDRLHDHSMDAPMHLWDALDARRTAQIKQKNRRKMGLWLTSAVLLLGTAGASLLWINQEENTPQVPAIQQQELKKAPAVSSDQVRADATKELETKSIHAEETATAITSIGSTKPDTGEKAAGTSAAKLLNQKETRVDGNTKREVSLPADESILPNQINTANNTTQQAILNSLPPDQGVASGHVNNANLAGANQTEAATEVEATEEETLPLEQMNELDPRNFDVAYEPVFALEGRPLYVPRTRGWRVYGELFGAVDVPTRTLEAREPEFELYRQAREQSEQVQAGQRVALRFSMISIDGIAVRSGISYGTHRETFSYQQTKQNNRFQTIDIPVILGYERNNLGKFTLSANAGVYLNMAFNQHGNFLAPDLNKTLEFSSNKPDAYPAFRNSLGVALYGSIAASYPITPRLRLVLEPYVLRNTGSFTAKDYAIDQRYQNWGINVGIRKKINKYIYFAKP